MFSSHLNWYYLKMSVKKLMIQLERHINYKFPEFDAKFYSIEGTFIFIWD